MNTITKTARNYLYLDQTNKTENKQSTSLWKVTQRPSCYLSLGLLPLIATLVVGVSNLASYLIKKLAPENLSTTDTKTHQVSTQQLSDQQVETTPISIEEGLNTWATKEKCLNQSSDNVDKAVKCILSAYTNNEQNLRLNGLKLRTLPPEIGQLSNLKTLYLSNNQLTTLPPEIGQLSNLKTQPTHHPTT